MADPSQISSFFSQWSPYAIQAGAQLGVSPGVILGQWGLESGYGTNSLSSQYNVGSIQSNGGWASYSSPQDFTNNYVSLIKNVYSGALNAGSNALQFAQGLASGGSSGNLSYFGNQSPQSYAASISGVSDNISNSGTSSVSPGWYWGSDGFQYGTGKSNDPTTSPSGSVNLNKTIGNPNNLLTGDWLLRISIGLIALILIGVGVVALAMKAEPLQVVKNAVAA